MRHLTSARRSGVLLLLGACALAGCAGNRRSHHDGSPDARPDTPAMAADGVGHAAGDAKPAPGASAARPGAGALEVTVIWDQAPPRLRSSPGRNPCGAARPAAVHVHTLGGVAGAAVYLRGAPADTAPAAAPTAAPAAAPIAPAAAPTAATAEPAAEPAEPAAAPAVTAELPAVLAVQQCRVEPRVVVARPGAVLALINDDERRHDVGIERLAGVEPGAGAGAAAAAAGPGAGTDTGTRVAPAAILALPVVGSRAALRWTVSGIYRVAAAGVDPGFVVVPAGGHAAVTSAAGTVRFADLPIGSYDVMTWHPPVDDAGAALTARARVTIVAGKTSHLTIPLTGP
jgi:hypothetical protein